ncbi:MAG TPA: four helix bundle suffix domain-containing protein [Candidatus Angelobacter sp.]|nr:four helix bundle suffix domain-containing protein [Candidatus Angelobacter sp.]
MHFASPGVYLATKRLQNIAEGSQAAGTSKKTELKLTNVARASLEELRLDYEDFLRQRALPLWERKDRRDSLIARRCTTADCVAEWAKEQHHGLSGLGGPIGQKQTTKGPAVQSNASTKSIQSTMSTYPEIAANAVLVLVAVACSLLDRQLASLAAAFEREGGFTERLYRVRKNARGAAR